MTSDRRMTTGGLLTTQTTAVDNDVSHRFQRLSVVSGRSNITFDNDLIGPQRIIQNESDAEESADVNQQEPQENQDKSERSKELLYSLTRLPADHPAVNLLRNRQREPPKKMIGYPSNMKSQETQKYHHLAINKYLSRHGYSDSLPTSYRQISSLQFEHIFNFLLGRIFPNFKFASNDLRHKVKYVAENLKYPLADSVVKSLSGLGTMHTTFLFNAFLHFLVNLAEGMDKPLLAVEEKPFEVDREGAASLLFDYTLARLNNKEPTIADQKLQDAFGDVNRRNARKIEETKAEIARVRAEIARMQLTSSRLSAAVSRNNEVKRDLTKFNTRMEYQRKKIDKFKDLNSRVSREVVRSNEKVESLGKENKELHATLEEKNVTVEMIKQLIEDRASLEGETSQCASSLESIKQQSHAKREKINRLKEQVKTVIEEYNTKVRSMPYFTPDNQSLLIDYSSLIDDTASNDLQNIISQLERMNDAAKSDLTSICKETYELRETVSQTETSVNEAKTELESLEKQGMQLKEEYEEKHLLFRNEAEKLSKLISSQEKEQDLKLNEAENAALEAKERLNVAKESINSVKLNNEIHVSQLVTKLQKIATMVSTHLPKDAESDLIFAEKEREDILGLFTITD